MAVIDKNKFLGKNEKGGSLAVRPKEELTKISKPEESSLYTIKSKVVQIDKLLKGTLAFEKVKRKQEKQDIEQEQRSQKEQDVEKPKQDDQEKDTPNKIKVPKLSFLDGVKNFLKNILIGWLAVRLLDNLPAVLKVLKVIAKVADWLIDFVGKILNGLATFIDWGYRAYDATRSFIGNVFGRKGVQIFDGIAGTLNKVFNLIGMIALAALAFGGENRNQSRSRTPDLPGRTRWGNWGKNNPIGKVLRNLEARRLNITRGFQQSTFGKTLDSLRPKNILNTIGESRFVKNIKNIDVGKGFTNLTKRFTDSGIGKNLRNIDLGKTFTNVTKRIGDSSLVKNIRNIDVKKTLQKVGNFLPDIGGGFRAIGRFGRRVGGEIVKVGGDVISGAYQGLKNFGGSTLKYIQEIPAKVKTQYDDIAKKIGPIIGERLGNFKSKFDEIGATLGKQLDKLSPSKMLENITNAVKKNLDKVVDGNPAVKKLLDNLKPKKAMGFISKNFDKLTKKTLPIVDVVRKNKGLADGLGPVDIAIDAIFALVDYGMFGESPVNAILKATAGTLGFAAGSALGLAATGGVPSPLTFLGGIIGASLAEWVTSKMISAVLKKFPGLKEIQDPIAENLGLTPRPLIRDPSGLLDHMIKGAGSDDEEISSDINNSTTTTNNNSQNGSELVSGASNDRSGSVANFASYEESNNGTTIIMSNDGGANSNVSGGNNDTAVSSIDTGSSATSDMQLAAYAGG
tara:strand:- start:40 stop:2247 length:2208 start_codon:yes stop_codon:yes gene_type:complete